MFTVELNEKYYAFDEGELYQGRRLFGNNTFSINSKLLKVYDVLANDDGVEVIFVNTSPVLVGVDDYLKKLDMPRFSMDFDFLEIIPIDFDEYNALETLSECQNQDNTVNKKAEEVHEEIKKYIKRR